MAVVSEATTYSVAPAARASSSFSGETSTAMIVDAPAIRAAWRAARPTPPTPKTATVSPARTRARVVDRAVAGEDRAAEQGGVGERDAVRERAGRSSAATTVSSAKAATFRPGWRSAPSAVRA